MAWTQKWTQGSKFYLLSHFAVEMWAFYNFRGSKSCLGHQFTPLFAQSSRIPNYSSKIWAKCSFYLLIPYICRVSASSIKFILRSSKVILSVFKRFQPQMYFVKVYWVHHFRCSYDLYEIWQTIYESKFCTR